MNSSSFGLACENSWVDAWAAASLGVAAGGFAQPLRSSWRQPEATLPAVRSRCDGERGTVPRRQGQTLQAAGRQSCMAGMGGPACERAVRQKHARLPFGSSASGWPEATLHATGRVQGTACREVWGVKEVHLGVEPWCLRELERSGFQVPKCMEWRLSLPS